MGKRCGTAGAATEQAAISVVMVSTSVDNALEKSQHNWGLRNIADEL